MASRGSTGTAPAPRVSCLELRFAAHEPFSRLSITPVSSSPRNILIIAGGGGGGGIINATTPNKGGDGGGERGEDGSSGNLGGRQISTGNTDYYNFGSAPTFSGSSTTYSGGGGGFFGGEYGTSGHSGAGGSGYVGGVPGFVHNKKFYGNLNEVGVNEGNGYSFIRYVTYI